MLPVWCGVAVVVWLVVGLGWGGCLLPRRVACRVAGGWGIIANMARDGT